VLTLFQYFDRPVEVASKVDQYSFKTQRVIFIRRLQLFDLIVQSHVLRRITLDQSRTSS